jgi:hypothetical protein
MYIFLTRKLWLFRNVDGFGFNGHIDSSRLDVMKLWLNVEDSYKLYKKRSLIKKFYYN